MVGKIVRLVLVAVGGAAGFQVAAYTMQAALRLEIPFLAQPQYLGLGIAVGALVGFLGGPLFLRAFTGAIERMVVVLHRTPTQEIVAGLVGLVAGMLVAILATSPLPRELPLVGGYLPVIVTLCSGYVGMTVAAKKKDDLLNFIRGVGRGGDRGATGPIRIDKAKTQRTSGKILDTSAIIDGRIADVADAGFLEGRLIVPGFVLRELQQIADSSDTLKRNRGRRGLDILGRMQQESRLPVQVLERDYDGVPEVDDKLVRLAQALGAKVVTNDFNLNKVAELHGVSVLNVNELANAVKPVVLPGEEMVVQVIRDGKEQGQGVGYLDDGTMIVVEGGRRHIGSQIEVLVTSVLQTSAGRMIFAKPKAAQRLG